MSAHEEAAAVRPRRRGQAIVLVVGALVIAGLLALLLANPYIGDEREVQAQVGCGWTRIVGRPLGGRGPVLDGTRVEIVEGRIRRRFFGPTVFVQLGSDKEWTLREGALFTADCTIGE